MHLMYLVLGLMILMAFLTYLPRRLKRKPSHLPETNIAEDTGNNEPDNHPPRVPGKSSDIDAAGPPVGGI